MVDENNVNTASSDLSSLVLGETLKVRDQQNNFHSIYFELIQFAEQSLTTFLIYLLHHTSIL